MNKEIYRKFTIVFGYDNEYCCVYNNYDRYYGNFTCREDAVKYIDMLNDDED